MAIRRISESEKANRAARKPEKSETASRNLQLTGPMLDNAIQHGTTDGSATATTDAMLHLQRRVGNRAVQRLLMQRVIQAKLTVGPAGDKFEQEADRAAAQVMSARPLQRQASPEEEAVQTKPEPQHVPVDESFEAGREIENRLSANEGSGSPLPGDTQSFMESRFGADFRSVRVHTDGESAQLNRDLSAQAFTHGSNIYFDEGKYDPGTDSGKRLLAHELTHVIQQGGAQAQAAQPVRRQVGTESGISAGEVRTGATLQLARGKAGRFFGSVGGWLLSLIPTLGLSALYPGMGDLTARMGFGFESDRTKTPRISPKTRDYASKKIEIRSADVGGGKGGKNNYVLRGVQYTPADQHKDKPGKNKAIVLLSGSGGSNESQLEPLARFYCTQGSTVFAVNYRGYGESKDVGKSGEESMPYLAERGLYDDAYKIYHYVESQGYSAGDIVIHGYSLGGGIASHLAKRLAKEGKKLGGLVLHSSIESSYEAARQGVPIPGYGKLAGLMTKMSMGSFDTKSHLKQLAEADPDLPIHLMSGAGGEGDQLSLGTTGLANAATDSFSDVSSRESSGSHLSTGTHIADPQQQQMLAALLAKNRGSATQWVDNPLFG